MTSIQGAYSQLLGAAAGAATAGSYMTRQSDWYKAKQAEQKVDKINKSLSLQEHRSLDELSETEAEYLTETAETGVNLREQALVAAPTEKRAKALEKAQTTKQTLNTFLDLKSSQVELQKAEQTIRDVLLGNDLRAGKKNQTLEYQKALETVRAGYDPKKVEFIKEHLGGK